MAEYHALGGAPATWMYAARIQLCLVKGATWRRLGRGRFQLAQAEQGRKRLGGGAAGEREGEEGVEEGEAEGRQRVALRQLARARELWQEMRAHGLQADKYAASAMIAVCGRAGRADDAERVMAGVALGGSTVGGNTAGGSMVGERTVAGEAVLGEARVGGEALGVPGVGGQVELGKVLSDAGAAVDAVSSGFNDVVVWNALADAWSRSGDAVRSEGVLSRMLHSRCPPNLRSYNIVLNAYAKTITPVVHGHGDGHGDAGRDSDHTEEQVASPSPSMPPRLSPSETIHRMRQLIASMSRQESPPTSSNAVRSTSRQGNAARVPKSTSDAVALCTITSGDVAPKNVAPDTVTPDIVTFNTLLDACARAADADAAVDTWRQMIGSGITPSEASVSSLTAAFRLAPSLPLDLLASLAPTDLPPRHPANQTQTDQLLGLMQQSSVKKKFQHHRQQHQPGRSLVREAVMQQLSGLRLPFEAHRSTITLLPETLSAFRAKNQERQHMNAWMRLAIGRYGSVVAGIGALFTVPLLIQHYARASSSCFSTK
ncbi:unnamed protein product [Closterium sp. Yama58-4]|nr:unnamed protein product [Closterium sp. Yama58-4]